MSIYLLCTVHDLCAFVFIKFYVIDLVHKKVMLPA